ncbi:hypothetical protein [Rhizobium sp. RU36D]|uniref:hypothetical protein n=1 Tax=Rhizobium sp. RU36D TaxID=1907415 RepID=UPI0015C43DD0|nr:hypothetical protein [Rhizobium sp. RU36D]
MLELFMGVRKLCFGKWEMTNLPQFLIKDVKKNIILHRVRIATIRTAALGARFNAQHSKPTKNSL